MDFNLIWVEVFSQQLDNLIKHLDCRLDFYKGTDMSQFYSSLNFLETWVNLFDLIQHCVPCTCIRQVVCLISFRTEEIETRLLPNPNAVEDRKKETLVAFNGFIRDVILNIPVIACRLCHTGPEEGMKIWLGKQNYVKPKQ